MPNYDINKILSHKNSMILLDNIVEYNEEELFLISVVTINDKNIFFDKAINGVPACIGIEFMMQTISCYSYLKYNNQTQIIKFLLGAKLMNLAVDKFENGRKYTIKVKESFTNKEIVAFDCMIYSERGEELASSTVNVYQGGDIEQFLKQND